MGEIDTIPKRARLPTRKNPYWQGVSGGRGGVSLGYRRGATGPGSWVAKIVVDGRRIEERLGVADDDGADGGALGYKAAVTAALAWSQQQHSTLEMQRETGTSGKGPTVRSAVERYSEVRKARSASTGANAAGRLAMHVLSAEAFAATPLSKLRAGTIEAWRATLPEEMAPATVNRLLNDLRAALNAAAEAHRRELPAAVVAEIKVGTRALTVSSNAREQILSEADVRAIVEVAATVDDDGDFGRLVLLAAATGARHSQLASLKVGDVQAARGRVLMPSSKKGRAARAKPPAPIPLAPDVLERLRPALSRPKAEPLLLRWAYRNVGPFKWEKDHRRAWGPAYEVDKPWTATLAAAGVAPDTVMYALRHTSIVRGLVAGLPVRLVAALHDTSVEMIEAHYSAYIVDATEDLARRAALSLAGAASGRQEAAK